MGQQGYSRRDFISYVAIGGGAVLLSACTPGTRSKRTGDTNGRSGAGVLELPPIEGGVVITDPGQIPAKFSESPEFAKLVQAGQLPPVAERIGQDPLVIKPLRSIGTYGGELRHGYVGVADHQTGRRFASGPDSLLYWDYGYKKVMPNIAREYELSTDAKVLTLHLRRGMRWRPDPQMESAIRGARAALIGAGGGRSASGRRAPGRSSEAGGPSAAGPAWR